MPHSWSTLTSADGRETPAPTDQQLAAVLTELYALGKQGAAGAEPATAALRFGYDDGLMYVAEVSSTGDICFEEWSDRDCELSLAAPRRMHASKAKALELWSLMAKRQVSRIRALVGWAAIPIR